MWPQGRLGRPQEVDVDLGELCGMGSWGPVGKLDMLKGPRYPRDEVGLREQQHLGCGDLVGS